LGQDAHLYRRAFAGFTVNTDLTAENVSALAHPHQAEGMDDVSNHSERVGSRDGDMFAARSASDDSKQ
jgi:hypothetical protein